MATSRHDGARWITAVVHATIILWRPICLMGLSSHGPKNTTAPLKELRGAMLWQIKYLEYLKNMTLQSEHRGRPTLVCSMAWLLWNRTLLAERVNNFLPQANVDPTTNNVVNANTKAQDDFGSLHPPDTFGYNVATNQCDFGSGTPHNRAYESLNAPMMARLRAVDNFLTLNSHF